MPLLVVRSGLSGPSVDVSVRSETAQKPGPGAAISRAQLALGAAFHAAAPPARVPVAPTVRATRPGCEPSGLSPSAHRCPAPVRLGPSARTVSAAVLASNARIAS